MKRSALAAWRGGLDDGKGLISTENGALAEARYGSDRLGMKTERITTKATGDDRHLMHTRKRRVLNGITRPAVLFYAHPMRTCLAPGQRREETA